MSINQMLLAMKAKVGSPARKLVLIKLADNSSDTGYCFPSYKNISEHCEMSKRSVIIHINSLEKDGFLVKRHRKTLTGNTSNAYQLSIESRGEESAPPSEESAPPSEESAPPLVKNLHPEPVTSLTSHLTSQEHIRKKRSASDVVELFNNVTSLRKVKVLSDARKRAIRNLEKEIPSMDAWGQFFKDVEESDFLTGRSGDWQATFDWLIKPANAIKVAEGNYKNKTRPVDDMSWAEGCE